MYESENITLSMQSITGVSLRMGFYMLIHSRFLGFVVSVVQKRFRFLLLCSQNYNYSLKFNTAKFTPVFLHTYRL